MQVLKLCKVAALQSEAYSEQNRTSKMEFFTKRINGFHPLTMLTKNSILDVRLSLEDASETLCFILHAKIPPITDFISNIFYVCFTNNYLFAVKFKL